MIRRKEDCRIEERFAIQFNHVFRILLPFTPVHIGMERQRVGDTQVHLRIAEQAIIEAHRIDMNMRLELRFLEE